MITDNGDFTYRPSPTSPPAEGTMVFARMLYFWPSIASVLVKLIVAALAAAYLERKMSSVKRKGRRTSTNVC